MDSPAHATPLDSRCSYGQDTMPGLACRPDQVPADLVAGAPIVNFRVRPKRNGKYDKIPLDPNSANTPHGRLRAAAVDDPATWGTFDDAVANLDRPGVAGLSRIMTADDDVVGLDWDGCVAVDGTIAPEVLAEISELGCYAELSWSGHGVRGFMRGQLPVDGRKVGTRECYQAKRHLTITGHHIAGTPTTLQANQPALEAWYHQHFDKGPAAAPRAPAAPLNLDDTALLEKARAAKDGDKFAHLWAGDSSDYGDDESAGDQALCNILRFWTQGDAARMDRLFRQSGRMRPKWDERRGAQTYGERTIAKACDGGEVYSPRPPGNWPVLSPAMMAELASAPNADPRDVELARLRAQVAAAEERAERAEAYNRALLKALSNPYLRNEVRLMIAEATEYLSALSRGAVDADGLAWLYIGSKDDDGLAGRAGISPRTISRQLDRHSTYQVDGQPLVELREDEVESSDGRHRTRYRFKVPFLEAGGTLPALVEKLAEYEPPGVETGARQAPGGNRCRDCGGPLEREVQRFRRVQTIERARITCRQCGQVHDEPERVLKTETHLERVQTIRLDLPELGQDGASTGEAPSPAMMAELPDAPCAADAELASSVIVAELDDTATVGAAVPTSPAIMAEVVAAAPAPPADSAATVEDHLGATPCPVPPTLLRCPDCGRPTLPNDKLSCSCASVGPPVREPWPVLDVASAPRAATEGPALPPGFTHWCPGDHRDGRVPLPPRAERCSKCERPWRAPQEAS
jgi:putative DNA primase/helicase